MAHSQVPLASQHDALAAMLQRETREARFGPRESALQHLSKAMAGTGNRLAGDLCYLFEACMDLCLRSSCRGVRM